MEYSEKEINELINESVNNPQAMQKIKSISKELINKHALEDYLYGCYIIVSKDGKDVVLDSNTINDLKKMLKEKGYNFEFMLVKHNSIENYLNL